MKYSTHVNKYLFLGTKGSVEVSLRKTNRFVNKFQIIGIGLVMFFGSIIGFSHVKLVRHS